MQGDLDALAHDDVRVGRDGAALGHYLRRAVEHGGEAKEVLLLEVVIRRVVAAGAGEVHPEEGLGDDLRAVGSGHVVLRGEAEAGGAAAIDAAFHRDQFGGEAVHRFVVEERLVNPPAERAGVVERGFEDAGVLGEHVLPVADPVVRPAGQREEAVNRGGPLGRRAVREKGAELFGRGRHAHGVEGEAAEEGRVVRERRGLDVCGGEAGGEEAVNVQRLTARADGVRHGGRGLRSEEFADGFVALRPILVLGGVHVAAALGVGGGEAGELLGGEVLPREVVVRDAGGGGEEDERAGGFQPPS